MSPDDAHIVSFASDGEVIASNAINGSLVRRLRPTGTNVAVRDIAFGVDMTVAIALADGSIVNAPLDARGAASKIRFTPSTNIHKFRFSRASGVGLFTEELGNGSVFDLVLLHDDRKTRTLRRQGDAFDDINLSASGRWFAAAGRGTLIVWNVAADVVADFSQRGVGFREIVFSDDEELLLNSSYVGSERKLAVWDLMSKQHIFYVPGTSGALSPDGSVLVALGLEGIAMYSTPELQTSFSALLKEARRRLDSSR